MRSDTQLMILLWKKNYYWALSVIILLILALTFYTVSEHHVTVKSKELSSLWQSGWGQQFFFLLPLPPPADEAPLDKGSLCLKGLWFPWACGRCWLPNKPCTHNLQTGPGRGVRDHSLLCSPLCFWQPANSIPALWRCHNLSGKKREGACFHCCESQMNNEDGSKANVFILQTQVEIKCYIQSAVFLLLGVSNWFSSYTTIGNLFWFTHFISVNGGVGPLCFIARAFLCSMEDVDLWP